MSNLKLSVKELANMFDQTLLKPFVSDKDFKKLCEESVEYGFKMVAINSAATALCKKYLKGTNVHVGAAISFPLGQTTIEAKVFEADNAIKNGADEIDYVINIVELKNKNYEYIEEEMREIVSLCKANNITVKVIFENCYLTSDEKKKLCEIALKIRPDFIKTSTGFGSGGATIEDLNLMRYIVGDNIKIKVAGGIRDLDTTLRMIKSGAQRIGTSSGVKIIEEYKKLLNK